MNPSPSLNVDNKAYEWPQTQLGDCCDITRGASPRPIMSWLSESGTPWVKISDATSQPGKFIDRTKEFIKDEARSKSVVVVPGDLIVSNSATPGLPKFMKIEACIHDGWLLFRNFRNLMPEFLYYRILNDRRDLIELGNGSVFTNLKTEILKQHTFPLPPVNIQKKIIEFLSDMDELIELNNQIAKTLEEIAQTIFKSWFVDFDPVYAKSRGEKPVGMDEETAALFPDSFDDSELGPIPTGWIVKTVADVVDRRRPGKLFEKKTVIESGKVPVLDQGQSGLIGYHNEEPGVDASPDNPYVVFANHTCSLRIISYPFSVIQNVFPLKGKELDVIWLYFALQGKQQFDSYKGHWPDLAIKKIVTPPAEITVKFSQLVEPFLKNSWVLNQENETLANLRDSLLPRLISGELEIPEGSLVSS